MKSKVTPSHACAGTEERYKHGLNPFAGLSLETGMWSAPLPGRFTPRKDTVPIAQKTTWATGNGLVRHRKSRPLPAFDLRTIQPINSRYTIYAITAAQIYSIGIVHEKMQQVAEMHFCSICRVLRTLFNHNFKVTGRLRLKYDGTRAETRFRFSAKRTSPFKSVGASVQSTIGSRGVPISFSNAGYTMFRGSVKGTGNPLHSPVSPSLPLPCVTVCHHISTGN